MNPVPPDTKMCFMRVSVQPIYESTADSDVPIVAPAYRLDAHHEYAATRNPIDTTMTRT
jgi:hypothetical protein